MRTMKNSKEAGDQSDHCHLPIANCQFVLATLGVAIYLCFFFAAPFKPYQSPEGVGPNRAFFFSYLLLPDEFFSTWLGPESTVSFSDRMPILLTVVFCIASATGIGLFFLTVTRVARKLSALETWIFATVLGLSFYSVLMLRLGLRGDADNISGVRFLTGFGALAFGFLCSLRAYWEAYDLQGPEPPPENTEQKFRRWPPLKISAFFLVLPIFSILLILGGMIPSTDYDVLSYHMAGTREFFESGRIDFMPHNVYANMPFGTEMFFLWGMALTGNAFTGTMVGKTLIAVTTMITALGIYAFGRRYFSETAGLVGMTLYMTTPWIFYVSTVGLVDTVVGMYAFFAIYAVMLLRDTSGRNLIFLAGFLAGSAAACKYPAMLFVVFPIGVYLLLKSRTREVSGFVPLLIFAAAVLISCGGWYLKNWFYTGNPVYPLCFSIFGDSTGTWTHPIDARWTRVHAPHGFGVDRFLHDFLSVGLTSPWNGPLTIPFCGLLLLVVPTAKTQARSIIAALMVWLVFFFATWWLLTHRIDRFWLPAMPALCVLAGVGAAWSPDVRWNRVLNVFIAITTVYCFLVSGSPAPGKLNRYFASLDSIRKDPGVSTSWAVGFNEHPPEGKILLIGEAKAFLYDVPVLYNSCWNETPLKEIVEPGEPAEEFRKRNIAFVLVDWSEIRRFRSPGNYGYSEFVHQDVFDRLVADGVLERYLPNKELAESPTAVYRVNP